MTKRLLAVPVIAAVLAHPVLAGVTAVTTCVVILGASFVYRWYTAPTVILGETVAPKPA